MRNPIAEVKALIIDSQKLAGVVGEVKDSGAEVTTAKGKMFLPYDISVRRGDVVTISAGRIVSKQSLGEGTVYNV